MLHIYSTISPQFIVGSNLAKYVEYKDDEQEFLNFETKTIFTEMNLL